MNAGNRWRALLVLAVIAGSVWVSITQPIRLGLDLRGGTQIVLEAQDTPQVTVDADVTERSLEVLRRRVDALGVAEPALQRSGQRRIIVELPGVDDPDEAIEVIGRTAQLTIHPVLLPESLFEPELDLAPDPEGDPEPDAGNGNGNGNGNGAGTGTDDNGGVEAEPQDDAGPEAGAQDPGDTPGIQGIRGQTTAADRAAGASPRNDARSAGAYAGTPDAEGRIQRAAAGPEHITAGVAALGGMPGAPADPGTRGQGDEGDDPETGTDGSDSDQPDPDTDGPEAGDPEAGDTGTDDPEGEPVPEPPPSADGGFDTIDDSGAPIRLGPAAMTGEQVAGAQARFDSTRIQWHVEIDFRNDRQWVDLTAEAACHGPGDPRRRVAIMLDDEVISSPPVADTVPCGVGITGGSTVISGAFSEGDARELALLVRAGALPVPVEIIEQRTVGPTLGEAAIDASIQATIIGAALTILFLLAYYRILGVLAALALAVYGLVAMALLQVIGATLTLPGIAGFVLAIGMAVDGNILIFERSKEEFADGRSLRMAGRAGFNRAFSAILDANITTLIAAGVLFLFASGGVRGFGITVGIGVLVSMFTALIVTRMLIELVMRRRWLADRPKAWGMGVGAGLRAWVRERGPDLVARRGRLLAASALLVVVAAGSLVVRDVQYGLDFTGGRLIEYETDDPADLDAVRSELASAGFPRAVVQESGEGNVAVRVRELDEGDDQVIDEAMADQLGRADRVRDEFVGPTIGAELRRNAIIAVVLALTLQLAYLAVRFRWTYGVSSIIALVQGALIVLGTFIWLGKEIDAVFVAALLTVVGYAVNDSVVVFDRIREQRAERPKDTYSAVANDAVLETLPRTINTGISTLFILVALWALGGETLADFALALIIGIVAGTTSTVITAMPLSTLFEGSPADATRVERRPARRATGDRATDQVPAGATTGGSRTPGAASGTTTAPTTPDASLPTVQRAIPPRPRKKKNRR